MVPDDTMSPRHGRGRERVRGHGWEKSALRALEYPANLALSNVAWVILALPLITILPAVVALATALDRWLRFDEQRPFRGTFAAFLPAVRRLWALSLASTVFGTVLALNFAFLSSQEGRLPALLAGTLVPIAVAYVAVHTALVPIAARRGDLTQMELLRASAWIVLRHPVRTLLLVVAVAASSALFLWPPLAMTFGASVPVFLCLTAQPDRSVPDQLE